MSEVSDYWKPELEKAQKENRRLGLLLRKKDKQLQVAREALKRWLLRMNCECGDSYPKDILCPHCDTKQTLKQIEGLEDE